MGQILAIDYGKKRIGVAATDDLQIIASGLATVPNKEIMTFLESYLAKNSVECIVVGDARQADGSHSHISEEADKFAEKLEKRFPELKHDRQDEAFSSRKASAAMIQGGVKKKQRRDKSLIDKVAATIILQEYLERTQ